MAEPQLPDAGQTAPSAQRTQRLQHSLAGQREHIWGLCYRMTGSSADADDLTQDTFRRALEAPPPDLERELRPWLVRVAVNLCKDALRERKRRGYNGTWLPSAIETSAAATSSAQDPEARYGQLESVTFAFLIALEALTATQRAVLLLRDVFDYSVAETAAALQVSGASVKTSLHRARHAMAAYDRNPQTPTPERAAQLHKALQALCMHLLTRNVAALEALLSDDVRARNDGAGKLFAARKPVLGKAKVITFSLKVGGGTGIRAQIRSINGLPALVALRAPGKHRVPTHSVTWLQLDPAGKICSIDTLVAHDKLRSVDWASLPTASGAELVSALGAALQVPPPAQWVKPAARRVLAAGVARANALLARGRSKLARRRRSRKSAR